MATTLKLKRGTTTQHGSFTGSQGEVTFNTTKNTIVAHDGSTQGGFEIARADMNNVTTEFISQSNLPNHVAMGNFVNFGHEVSNQVDVASTNGAYNPRQLNVTDRHDTTNQTWFAINTSLNAFSLTAGKYFVMAYFQTSEVGSTKIILINTDNSSVLKQTHPLATGPVTGSLVSTTLHMQGYFSLSSDTSTAALQFQQNYSSSTNNSVAHGYSNAAQGSYNERYTDVAIWRIGS